MRDGHLGGGEGNGVLMALVVVGDMVGGDEGENRRVNDGVRGWCEFFSM